MRTPRIIIRNLAEIRQRGIQRARRFDARSHGWLGLLWIAAREAVKPESSVAAAAIAYFSLFSLFPLILLSTSIASFSLGSLIDQQHAVIQRLEFVAPALGQLVGQNIDEIVRARGSITIVALVSLIWSASTIFYTLTGTLHKIWDDKHSRPVWKRRGLSILFVLAFVGPILFVASFVSSMITNLLIWMPALNLPIGDGISFAVAILLDISLFTLLYILLPHAHATWREILPGAMGAGLLWELAKKAFLFFVSTYISISNLVYGSVAAIFAILTWAYLSGIIFLFGAYLSLFFYQRKQQQQEAAGPIQEGNV